MTTNATVKTHDWPVQVTTLDFDQSTGALITANKATVIPPNSESAPHEICLWQGRSVLLTELPLPGKVRAEIDDPTVPKGE
jgi:hypothetical protein